RAGLRWTAGGSHPRHPRSARDLPGAERRAARAAACGARPGDRRALRETAAPHAAGPPRPGRESARAPGRAPHRRVYGLRARLRQRAATARDRAAALLARSHAGDGGRVRHIRPGRRLSGGATLDRGGLGVAQAPRRARAARSSGAAARRAGDLPLLVRGRRLRALAGRTAPHRARVGGSAGRARRGVGMDFELVLALPRVPPLSVRRVLGSVVWHPSRAARRVLGHLARAVAPEPAKLVRAGRPGDSQRLAMCGGDVTQRRSPVRRVRRTLLPRPHSPRTATLVRLDSESRALRELRDALFRTPREIPCKYFYDDAGSALFEQITRLPEYFPTRTERALLEARASAIVESAGGPNLTDVVELGSGAASKTVALLDAALAGGGRPRYVAVDISAHALRRTQEILAAERPEILVEQVLADYTGDLQLPPKPAGGRRLVLFLGGTIGNDEDEEAIKLLSRVREHMEPDDLLLLGANLVTDLAAIHLARASLRGL